MKKIFVFSLLFLALSNLLSAQTNHYKVTLWIHQLEDSTVYVSSSYGEKENIILDTLQLTSEGSFILEGDYKSGLVVVSRAKQKLFSFLLDKNPVFSIDMYPYGYFEVKGCDENKYYLEYQKRNKEFRQLTSQYELDIKKYPAEKDSLTNLIQKAKTDFSKYQNHFFNGHRQ